MQIGSPSDRPTTFWKGSGGGCGRGALEVDDDGSLHGSLPLRADAARTAE